MQVLRGRGLKLLFLTSEVEGVTGQRHVPAALYLREWSHWIGDWVGLRPGLDIEDREKILCPCRGSKPWSSSV
jgi:hypothetical protein